MTVPPNDSGRNPSDTSKQPALPKGDADKDSTPRVVDVEILHDQDDPHGSAQNSRKTQADGWDEPSAYDPFGNGAGSGQGQSGSQRQQFGGRFFYRGSYGQTGGLGGMNLGRVWMGGTDQNGCMAPAITFALFMVCLAQFGFLAGIGFMFFHVVGAVMGVFRDLRQLSAGRVPNPWFWRIGNWTVSFLLTAWLAGGFH